MRFGDRCDRPMAMKVQHQIAKFC